MEQQENRRHEIGPAFFGTAVMDVPRLALATAAAGPEPSVMALALLAGLTERALACPAFSDSRLSDGHGSRGTGYRIAGSAS